MKNNRILSIDVFRAITMSFMIWVNDFWTLNAIPKWLKHAEGNEDFLGFSDLIFPWFLFVMGMSIPVSINHRINRGDTKILIFRHIVFRTIALVIMGLFHMNFEMYSTEFSILSKPIFVIIATFAFFMIWNKYSIENKKTRLIFSCLRIAGALILIYLIAIYSGKDYNGKPIGFEIHWWGILGLIGWVYIITASSFLIIKNSLLIASIFFVLCLALNIISSFGIAYNVFSWQNIHWIPGNGGLQAISIGGIIVTLLLKRYQAKKNIMYFYSLLMSFGIFSLLLGFYLRSYFIISKVQGTPAWILLSLSTAIFLFIIIHWIIDFKKVSFWYNYIKVAGTATLTCYLIPYFYYNIAVLFGVKLPNVFTVGTLGLMKSFMYTALIIIITSIFVKFKLKIKI